MAVVTTEAPRERLRGPVVVALAVTAPLLLVVGGLVAESVQPPGTYDAVGQTVSTLAGRGATDRWIMATVLAAMGVIYLVVALGLRHVPRPARLAPRCRRRGRGRRRPGRPAGARQLDDPHDGDGHRPARLHRLDDPARRRPWPRPRPATGLGRRARGHGGGPGVAVRAGLDRRHVARCRRAYDPPGADGVAGPGRGRVVARTRGPCVGRRRVDDARARGARARRCSSSVSGPRSPRGPGPTRGTSR